MLKAAIARSLFLCNPSQPSPLCLLWQSNSLTWNRENGVCPKLNEKKSTSGRVIRSTAGVVARTASECKRERRRTLVLQLRSPASDQNRTTRRNAEQKSAHRLVNTVAAITSLTLGQTGQTSLTRRSPERHRRYRSGFPLPHIRKSSAPNALNSTAPPPTSSPPLRVLSKEQTCRHRK